MSIESMALVAAHSQSRGVARLVLMGIANHDGDGGAWPSVGTLCRFSNASERAVRSALRGLEILGELEVWQQRGGREMPDHLRPNWYGIRIECPDTCDGSFRHRSRG